MNVKDKTGKLSAEKLGRLLGRYTSTRCPNLLIGPKVGLDAAAIAVEKGALVLATDPVTYAVDQIGRYAVHINANDIFASGAEPQWFMADILLPPGQVRLAEQIFAQIRQACRELGRVHLIGGHTELTPGLDRPIVAGFMIGVAPRRRILAADRVQPGDAIILTKGVAIEGTAVLASELEKKLLAELPQATVRRAKRLLKSPGIGIGREARIAVRCGARAMHDPTEGGVLNGLWEMSAAAGVAIHVDPTKIPILPETQCLCEHLGINPLKLLASGSLVIACPPRSAGRMLKALTSGGVRAFQIGWAKKGKPGVHLGKRKVIRRSITDDILKVLSLH